MPRVVELSGVISKDTVVVQDERPDHKGLLNVLTKAGSILQVHARRIVHDDHDPNASMVIEAYGRYQTICPQCREVCILADSTTEASCSIHGKYPISSFGKPEMHNVDQSKLLDVAEIKKYGELWTKAGLEFDDPNVEAKAHVLLSTCTDGVARKLCFNTYSGSFGKHASGLELDAFIDGRTGKNGKKVGYDIKDSLDAERKRLEHKHYILCE